MVVGVGVEGMEAVTEGVVKGGWEVVMGGMVGEGVLVAVVAVMADVEALNQEQMFHLG